MSAAGGERRKKLLCEMANRSWESKLRIFWAKLRMFWAKVANLLGEVGNRPGEIANLLKLRISLARIRESRN